MAALWAGSTGHLPGVHRSDWAAELMSACADAKGHLSLPCSLRDQANHIGIFLISPSFDGAPVLFLKLYTLLLGEFNGQLHDVAGLMKVESPKPPRLTAVWSNCWAKHSLSMLVQHHPRYVFADELGTDWAVCQRDKHALVLAAQDGTSISPPIIDTEWLCSNSSCTDPTRANFETPPIVIVPPLVEFLQETMRYFRGFIDNALADPCRIRMFEGGHFHGLGVHLKGGGFNSPVVV